jgi:hypothetical protein
MADFFETNSHRSIEQYWGVRSRTEFRAKGFGGNFRNVVLLQASANDGLGLDKGEARGCPRWLIR